MISHKSTPKLEQVSISIAPLKKLRPSQSESTIQTNPSLNSLTRDMGLRTTIQSDDDSEELMSPRSMLSALDKMHLTHLDGVDILYNSISKELNIVREKIEHNNTQSTWRQIGGLITTIVISLIFNIFVFPKFSSNTCKSN